MQKALDLSALRAAVEGNDAKALAAFYAEDAELRVIDKDHPPSRPLVFRGRQAIGAMLDDVCGRAMQHHVDDGLVDGNHAAFAETCTYPDGVKVYMSAMLELADGRIRRQTNIQAWDS
jgi:hypothetical protein